jgi:hypothetical protein
MYCLLLMEVSFRVCGILTSSPVPVVHPAWHRMCQGCTRPQPVVVVDPIVGSELVAELSQPIDSGPVVRSTDNL